MNPSRWLEQEQYLRFKENPDALELMAFYHLLPSKLLDDFFMKKMNHIHVLFFDNDGKILRVYRFHPSHFNPDKTPRMELITTLTDSMKTGTTQPFMDKIDPFLVKKIFQN
jgi:uncharacterized membrane protein (UPF0127 family)